MHNAAVAYPVVLVESYAHLRAHSPILLLTILAFAITGDPLGIDIPTQEELVRVAMRTLGKDVIGYGRRSLDLVQALLVATFWSRAAPLGHDHATCYQTAQLAQDMAVDLGLAGGALIASPVSYFSHAGDTNSLEARRTWLACFVAMAGTATSLRRPLSVPWNPHHNDCLLHLERHGCASDRLLCQLVRVTKLIQDIAHRFSLYHLDVFVDANDPDVHRLMVAAKADVDVWKAQIPADLAESPHMAFWYHVALIHVFEVVLHTPTNKASFAAPFIPDRISVKDFPAPEASTAIIGEILALIVSSCHAATQHAVDMGPEVVLGMPSFTFSPALIYARFILVNVLVAVSSPGNVYGRYVDPEAVRVQDRAKELAGLVDALKMFDPAMRNWTTRLTDATSWLSDWACDYMAILQRYQRQAAAGGAS
jgi:hypothetical protein